MPLAEQLARLYDLRRDLASGYEKPYKPALLVALIDLIARGDIRDNRILLTPGLNKRYREVVHAVGRAGDRGGIEQPFFHLAGDGVWQVLGRDGRDLYASGSSPKALRRELDHATLDPELYALLQNPVDRSLIRSAIIARYFRGAPGVPTLELGHSPLPEEWEPLAEEKKASARSAAFARIVKEAYDYTCAASGVRLHDEQQRLSLVDACHLVPFAISRNDHPSNGIALAKDFHWALDKHLISPRETGTGFVWAVSRTLSDRSDGHRRLRDLADRPLAGPLTENRDFHPDPAAVRWRLSRLLN